MVVLETPPRTSRKGNLMDCLTTSRISGRCKCGQYPQQVHLVDGSVICCNDCCPIHSGAGLSSEGHECGAVSHPAAPAHITIRGQQRGLFDA